MIISDHPLLQTVPHYTLVSRGTRTPLHSFVLEKPSTDFERLVYEQVLHLLKIYLQDLPAPSASGVVGGESSVATWWWGRRAGSWSCSPFEAVKKDEGPTLTEAMVDGMKLCKLQDNARLDPLQDRPDIRFKFFILQQHPRQISARGK
ncbi:hypothetical protein BGZ70_005552, partial [Mortierella alpina]